MAKCFTLPKTLLFALLAGTLLLSTSCKKKDNSNTPNHIGAKYDLDIDEIIVNEAAYFDFIFGPNSEDSLKKIVDDLGIEYEINRTGGNITSVPIGSSGSKYEAKYNGDNQMTEHIYDSGPFKLKTTFDYLQGYVVAMHIYQMLQQSDGSFSEELVTEFVDMINNANGLQSYKMINYNAGVIFAVYLVAVVTSAKNNNLRNSQPYNMLSAEFTDGAAGIINMSSTCIEQLVSVRQSDSATTTVNITYGYDSKGRIIEKIISSSQAGVNDIKHNITYRNN